MRNNNNNNLVAFRSPALRYSAQLDDVRFRQAPYYRRSAPGYLAAPRPPLGYYGASLFSGVSGRMVLCTLVGCLVLGAVIGTVVGVVLGIGRGSSSSNSTSNLNSTLSTAPPSLNPTTSPSSPANLQSVSTSNVTGSTPNPQVSGSNPSQASQSVNPSQASSSSSPGSPATGSTVSQPPSITPGPAVSPNTSPPGVSVASPAAVTTGSKITMPPSMGTAGGSVGTQGRSVGMTSSGMRTGTVKEGMSQTTGRGITQPPVTSGAQSMTSAPQATKPPLVFCPNATRVLIYSRRDASAQFNRSWAEMRAGFGSESSNYWRGLDDVSVLTQSGGFKMRVYFQSNDTGVTYMAEYNTSLVGAESTGYQLTISGYSSTFQHDAFLEYNGYKFQTYDRGANPTNCASQSGGAWWYDTGDCSCDACLTQAGPDNFAWSLGLGTDLKLRTSSMELVCKN